jgi:multiple antibiotic resistance protein
MTSEVLRASVAFFAVIDPVGNLLIYHILTERFARRDRMGVALGSCLVAFATLFVFVLGGTSVLDSLRISLPSFEIAAGVLLVPPAFRLVEHGQPLSVALPAEAASAAQVAVAPLAIPLLAGPGALATAISIASTIGRVATLLAAALVLLFSAVLFLLGARVFRLLGPVFLRVLSRLVGILLMAIAVNFVVDGLTKVFR